MSFKNFIYYCAICGGWAAFLSWGLAEGLGIFTPGRLSASEQQDTLLRTAAISALLGLMIAFTIGLLDAILNASGFQRATRPLISMCVGVIGGLLGGVLGETLYGFSKPEPGVAGNPVFRIVGWAIVGVIIGASIGVFDVLKAVSARQPLRQALRKMINGAIGGTVGGILGGVSFEFIGRGFKLLAGLVKNIDVATMHSPRAVGLVVLGMCIGLLIGFVHVVLKEAWVKVEAGFRAGREMMLTKPEVIVGRAEGCDIALFGDPKVEKQHAKIILQNGRYVLIDNGTPGGTFVNGERINGPTPLRSGDRINLGDKSALRFGERQKRK